MAPREHLPSNRPPRSLRFRIFLGALYFGALCLLMLWEARERLQFSSSACDAAPSAPVSPLYDAPYRMFLHWSSHDGPPHVTILYIPAEFEEAQGGLCRGRAFLADVLGVLAAQHPAEIVIDKFYSPYACESSPESTSQLLSVVKSIQVPIVVGESTTFSNREKDGSCLVRRQQLDFGTPNVHRGITRLNADLQNVPLQWLVLPLPGKGPEKAQSLDSLAWTAVKEYDPTYAAGPRIQALIDSQRHPYADLDINLPRETTTALLCAAGTPEIQKRWALDCSGPQSTQSLLGRVVVIGSEDSLDQKVVMETRLWGFDLQARYIEVLLSGNYLRVLPFAASFGLFALFVFVMEGLPTLLIAFRPRWKRRWLLHYAYSRRRYIWVSFWAVFFIAASSVMALALRYLPPLPVLIDILFISVTRILFFAAESTETPFVHHAKSKGAHNAES